MHKTYFIARADVTVLWSSDSNTTVLAYDNLTHQKYINFDELSTITQESIEPIILSDEEILAEKIILEVIELGN